MRCTGFRLVEFHNDIEYPWHIEPKFVPRNEIEIAQKVETAQETLRRRAAQRRAQAKRKEIARVRGCDQV